MTDPPAPPGLTPSQQAGCAALQRLLTGALVASALFLGLLSLLFVWTVIRIPDPVEYRENAVVITTELLLAGENPYDLQHQPLFINVYGLGYHWMVLPFAKIWGPSLLLHRTISATFILLSCAVLYAGLRRTGVSWPLGLAAALLWLVHLARGLSLVSRPDSFGMFLFLLSVLVPFLWKFTPGSLCLSLLLGVSGFLAKPYFLLGVPCTCAYLFAFKSKRAGASYGFGALLLLTATLFVMQHFFPYYLTDVLFINANAAKRDLSHLLSVGGEYYRTNFGIVMILVWAIVLGMIRWTTEWRQVKQTVGRDGLVNLREQRKPMLGITAGFMPFMLGCNLIVMGTALGLHPGNRILYYDQLISPFLYWVVVSQVERLPRLRIPCLVLLVSTFWAWSPAIQFPPRMQEQEWRALESLIGTHRHVLASAPLAHLLRRQGKPIYATGQTEYFVYGVRNNQRALSADYLRRGEEFLSLIRSTATTKGFDLVALIDDRWLMPKEILSQNYVLADSKVVPLHFQGGGRLVHIYYPKP